MQKVATISKFTRADYSNHTNRSVQDQLQKISEILQPFLEAATRGVS